MRFDGKLTKDFVLGKPIKPEDYDPAVLDELEKNDRLIITRKRDGWKMFAAFDSKGRVRLYTDGMNEIDSRLDQVKKDCEKLKLRNALLVGEAVANVGDRFEDDDLTKVGAVMRAGTEKALELQKEFGRLTFMVFDIIFQDGQQVVEPFTRRLDRIQNMLLGIFAFHLHQVPVLEMPLDQAKKLVMSRKWEGLVLYDADFVNEIRLDGKDPKRPKGCYKWKPIFEDDFIVREKIMRPGKDEVKELVLCQIDPKNGEKFDCFKLGSFTGAMRKELAAKPCPFVVQVAFESRFAKSGKLRNPRFMHLRDDKRPQDCIAPQNVRSGS